MVGSRPRQARRWKTTAGQIGVSRNCSVARSYRHVLRLRRPTGASLAQRTNERPEANAAGPGGMVEKLVCDRSPRSPAQFEDQRAGPASNVPATKRRSWPHFAKYPALLVSQAERPSGQGHRDAGIHLCTNAAQSRRRWPVGQLDLSRRQTERGGYLNRIVVASRLLRLPVCRLIHSARRANLLYHEFKSTNRVSGPVNQDPTNSVAI